MPPECTTIVSQKFLIQNTGLLVPKKLWRQFMPPECAAVVSYKSTHSDFRAGSKNPSYVSHLVLKCVQFPIGTFGDYDVQRHLVESSTLHKSWFRRGYVCGVTCLTPYNFDCHTRLYLVLPYVTHSASPNSLFNSLGFSSLFFVCIKKMREKYKILLYSDCHWKPLELIGGN